MNSIKSILILLILSAHHLTAKDYYVSPTGDDYLGDGSFEMPFQTLEKVSAILKAGDTCFLRAGTYREQFRPKFSGKAGAPIIFKPFEEEKVIFSACNILSNWDSKNGDVYTTSMDWSVHEGHGNTVIINGKIAEEARWPNRTKYLNPRDFERNSEKTRGEIKNRKFAKFRGQDLTGSVAIVTGLHHKIHIAEVAKFDAKKPSIKLDKNIICPAESEFYLTRNRAFLDTSNEWFYDEKLKEMTIKLPSGKKPENMVIESKKREYCVDLRGRKHIQFFRIRFEAGGINTNKTSEHLIFEKCTFWATGRCLGTNGKILSKGANVVRGSHHSFWECEFLDSFGYGIAIGVNERATGNSVQNCLIENAGIDYNVHAGMLVSGSNSIVSNNTIRNTASSGIWFRGSSSEVSFNRIIRPCLMTKDSGGIYLVDTDYANSRIHHNIVSDVFGAYNSGIYVDGASENLLIDHNICHNIGFASGKMNLPARHIHWYFNTLIKDKGFDSWSSPSATRLSEELAIKYNILSRWRVPLPKNVNFDHNNFSNTIEFAQVNDKGSSPKGEGNNIEALEIGRKLGRNLIGEAFEAGALEDGQEIWNAGQDPELKEPRALQLIRLEYMNPVLNSSFEKHSAMSWNLSGGVEIIKDDTWNFRKNSFAFQGSFAARINNKSKILQTITDLKPNTRYRFRFYAKNGGRIVHTSKEHQDFSLITKDLSPPSSMKRKHPSVLSLHTDQSMLRLTLPHGSPELRSMRTLRLSYVASQPVELNILKEASDLETEAILLTSLPASSSKGRPQQSDIKIPLDYSGSHIILKAKQKIDSVKTIHFLPTKSTTNEISSQLFFPQSKESIKTIHTLKDTWNEEGYSVEFITPQGETEVTLSFESNGSQLSSYIDAISISRIP